MYPGITELSRRGPPGAATLHKTPGHEHSGFALVQTPVLQLVQRFRSILQFAVQESAIAHMAQSTKLLEPPNQSQVNTALIGFSLLRRGKESWVTL